MIIEYFKGFDIGFAFLTRLRPGRRIESEDFAFCMASLPLVGLVLGLIAVAPWYLGLFHNEPWIQAWLTVLLSLYLTRGLHLDGLADLADGMGAHLDPDRFWTIIKDSRTGVFGAVAAVLAVTGLIAGYSALYARGMYGAVVFSFVFGRGGIAALSFFCRDLTRPGLGGLFIKGATPGAVFTAWAGLLVAGALLVPVRGLAAAHFILFLEVIFFVHTARKVNGINGDFLGAAVVSAELASCVGCLL